MILKYYIQLLRPHQYIKNLFVFMPVFFSENITQVQMSVPVAFSFICFCMIASAVYILNDYIDIEHDRRHPQKKHRPLASGKINQNSAKLLCVVLLTSGLTLMAGISLVSMFVLAAYMVMNVGYSIKLKHIAILDVVVIAIGFVLRLYAGASAAGLSLSNWIVIMTFQLALFLALAKRRDDVLIFNSTGKKMRKSVDGYNLKFVDASMTLMSGVVIVSYIMYCTSENVIQRVGHSEVYLTALFVIIGIMRYMQITFVENNSGNPTKILLKDRLLQLTVVLWILTFIFLLYF